MDEQLESNMDEQLESNMDEQIGGNKKKNKSVIETDKKADEEQEEQEEQEEIDEDDLDEMVEEDFNLEDVAQMYNEEINENNKVINETLKLISQATNDKKWKNNIEEIYMPYDSKLDTLSYDSKLEDVYDKYYIYDEYIFKDDTVKVLRQKITVSIPVSPIYHKELKFLPET